MDLKSDNDIDTNLIADSLYLEKSLFIHGYHYMISGYNDAVF